MSNKRSIGSQGEDIAADYLISKGYEIIDKNYYTNNGEIDIVCKQKDKNNKLIFVEVKFRSSTQFGYPEESVDEKKFERMQKVAFQYIRKKGIDPSIERRFDIISILFTKGKAKIRHIKDLY